jgi:hypothetical protein
MADALEAQRGFAATIVSQLSEGQPQIDSAVVTTTADF